MMQKDFATHSCFKMLLKEKDLALRQRLRVIFPSGYHITPDNIIKMLDPAVQLLNPKE